MKPRHPDDFVLLRHTAGDLDDDERATIASHLGHCEACLVALSEIRRVDAGLREVARRRGATSPAAEIELAPDDPFRVRPTQTVRAVPVTRELAERALSDSECGRAEVEALLNAAAAESPEALASFLRRLSFADPAARYLLLYALDEAGQRIADDPARFLRLAEEALARLSRETTAGERQAAEAEALVPLSTIVGQAHLLAGQASNWTGALDGARRHFEDAYHSFQPASESDEIRLALTEYQESQRRSFAGSAAGGWVLARRARATFDAFGLEDHATRARVAEGIALSSLGRDEEALVCFRAAAPDFERQGLWKNYVSAINSLGASLARLGRLDEARREYSRALRKLSRERHSSLLAFTRNGLAHVLFSARRYTDAAKSFLQAARLFEELGLVGDSLTASLWEIESWARGGDPTRAAHRLEIFRSPVERLAALDSFIVRQLEEAVSGRDADLPRLAELRQRAEETIRENLKTRAG